MLSLDLKPDLQSGSRLATGQTMSRSGEIEMPAFDLRDTLSGMTVCELSFSDFLAALKQVGKHRR